MSSRLQRVGHFPGVLVLAAVLISITTMGCGEAAEQQATPSPQAPGQRSAWRPVKTDFGVSDQ
jgi:hypothetical protein